ncbi:DEAD/DEAH box helicase family protein, partial [Acinetobacter johnsonii]
PLTANPEQQHAIQQVLKFKNKYQAFLLDGLTGSGKTEVYLQIMEKVLKQGKQVLVLVPEIGLTPQTISRFQSRFHCHIALLHSGLND